VAVALTNQKKSVVYVEFRSNNGSAAYHFKLDSENDLGSLVKLDPDAIKRQEIESCLVQHRSGLRLLLAPTNGQTGQFTPGHTNKILATLEAGSEFVVLDIPPIIDQASLRALELSDQILLVTEPTHFSVTCAQAQLNKFKDWGLYSRTDIVILHRVRSAKSLSQVEVETRFGMKLEQRLQPRWEQTSTRQLRQFEQGVTAVIPSAPEMFDEAVNGRAPYILVEPSAPSARELTDLAEWITEKFA
jgi:Flp pilus assembly CpaE family ATPase